MFVFCSLQNESRHFIISIKGATLGILKRIFAKIRKKPVNITQMGVDGISKFPLKFLAFRN